MVLEVGVQTLVEILQRMPKLGRREAIRWRTGYRTRRMSYADLYARIGACAQLLDERGLGRGDRVVVWGTNRPEWTITFWACVARGIQVVPLDARSSQAFVQRIQAHVQAKLLVSDAPLEREPTESGQPAPRPFDKGDVRLDDIAALPGARALDIATPAPDDIVEIVFTSGTTGDPKGVVHRHRNICANLRPIAHEVHRLRLVVRLLGSVRVLDLLPLSHMFGQTVGLYVPVLLGGTAVFTDELSPGAVLDTIRRENVTAAAVVPRMLESLCNEVRRRYEPNADGAEPARAAGLLFCLWRHRALHRALGLRFWFFIVGGAAVREELERFWSHRGFGVAQGYGLTETSPIVTVNHPLRTRRGSIGRPLPGLDVRIAADGEILVRGDSVVSEYWTRRGREPVTGEGGWLHTGDLGAIDDQGQVYFKGRKKDVIVVADGSNVYPQDVEEHLNRDPAVRESTVVGIGTDGAQTVHAVFLLDDPSRDLESLVGTVNAALEPHQRVRSWSVWPESDFPRTLSTAKVRRVEVARAVEAERAHAAGADAGSGTNPHESVSGRVALSEDRSAPSTAVLDCVADVAQRDVEQVRPEHSLENDLGLASLDRVELLSALEHRLGIDLDETRFVEVDTVAALQTWVDDELRASRRVASGAGTTRAAPRTSLGSTAGATPSAGHAGLHDADVVTGSSTQTRAMPLPRWRSHAFVRFKRRIFQDGVLVPLFRAYYDFRVEGLEHLDTLRGPVLFAANHTSHFDTPVLLAALPRAWRRRVAPAMMSEYFRAHLEPDARASRERWLRGLQFHLACGLLNAFPIPQTMGGIRRVLQYMGEQVDAGVCPLVFPEGGRSRDGTLLPFKPGIGLMAARMWIPVVPVHLDGVLRAMPPGARWPRRGALRVRIGAALPVAPEANPRDAAQAVRRAIEALSAR